MRGKEPEPKKIRETVEFSGVKPGSARDAAFGFMKILGQEAYYEGFTGTRWAGGDPTQSITDVFGQPRSSQMDSYRVNGLIIATGPNN